MVELLGPAWWGTIIPVLLGLAFLTLIFALRPGRLVKAGAVLVAMVCFLIGIGIAVDERRAAEQTVAYDACRAAKRQHCERYLGLEVIISDGGSANLTKQDK